MDKYCPYCGTPVKKINGEYLCPNCGKIEESTETHEDEYKGYFG